MRRLAINGVLCLIGGVAVTGCDSQSATAPQSNQAAAAPVAAAPADVADQRGAATPPTDGIALAGPAVPGAIPDVPTAVQIVSENGKYVMRSNADDKPLYTYDRDSPGKSACTDSCAKAWPPLTAPADAKPVGNWTVVTRTDGSRQWALGGKPVYSFARDAEAVASGDGTGGVWHLLPAIAAK